MWALWQDGMRAIICSLSTAPAGTTMWSLPVWRDLPLLVGPTITLNKQAAEHLFSDACRTFYFSFKPFTIAVMCSKAFRSSFLNSLVNSASSTGKSASVSKNCCEVIPKNSQMQNRPLLLGLSYRVPFRPISAAFAFMPSIVSRITASSSIPSISHPLRTTSRLTPEAKDLSLNFFFTDFTSRSRTLLEGRMGRKNWLFSNTPGGAQGSATIYSLIETAKENHLDPYRYLLWIFKDAPKHAKAGDGWAEHFAPANAPATCKVNT